ncbi:hypothetical protein PHLGIDRAFT_117718 [Phlebiopsis gigantea 11061_1 CR5-6]|uniref:Uncharacterized protein n=1 Tax=Phlebiopsis gigantea (strain 11061_1 CR5-6) TaxID=745531 RepID=A0A0C3NRN6_PHLG1|nr:hypothetical protein PHLGIDRAFT_117718 [Phlebiopsis gigantea 11061_1 CR5-6]
MGAWWAAWKEAARVLPLVAQARMDERARVAADGRSRVEELELETRGVSAYGRVAQLDGGRSAHDGSAR